MWQLSRVTQKGQVTIPVSLRHHWGLQPREKVIFVEKKGVVEIRPAIDFFKLRGSLTKKNQYSDKKADKILGKYLAREYGQEK